jgi:anion-transporting  ArsA/GET3 family ATPase
MFGNPVLSSTFSDILAGKRIIVCVGSGGVGKTTTSAAVALEGARSGRRTLVLTIDPAKRLANSLGLDQLGHRVQRVGNHALDHAGPRAPGGELWAMMLDQKQAFDEVVTRYASNPDAVRRILANPVYQQISGSLAGSQEYAALAKLEEFDESGAWDLIVVDTPPTAHALDFLDAPEKLTNAIDSPAVDWFRKLRAGQGRSRWSMVGRTGSYVLKRITKFVGSQFLDDLAVFFTEFNDVLGGFRTRAEQVFALLREPRVGFVLVCSPEPMALDEALFFHQRLTSSAMPFSAFVVNKVHDDRPLRGDAAQLARRIAAIDEVAALGLDSEAQTHAAGALLANHAAVQALARADARAVERLREASGASACLCRVPVLRRDVHDVDGLTRIGDYLFRNGSPPPAAS